MTIYKNLWAGYETYFIRMANSGRYAKGIGIAHVEGRWKVEYNAAYYASDLRHDTEHFPIVGRIDLDSLIINGILQNITEPKKEE